MADTVDLTQRIRLVSLGAPARHELGALIQAIKEGHPLRPVTVVVPHPLAGVATRRALATQMGGVVNVRFDILPRIADGIAAASLAADGLAPLNNTILAAAARQVLREDPGLTLAGVASHPATAKEVSRFVTSYTQLSVSAQQQLAELNSKFADLAALVKRVQLQLAGYYNRHDALERAAWLIREQGTDEVGLGQVITYLPTTLGPSELAFYQALANNDQLWGLVGQTNNTEANTTVNQVASQLNNLFAAIAPPHEPVGLVSSRAHTGTKASVEEAALSHLTMVDTSDPDEEVRAVLREVVQHWQNGIPLERMAVLYPNAEPYATLLYHQATEANITIAGASVSSLHASIAGSVLLMALGLNPNTLERHRFINWLYSGPIIDGTGQLAPVPQWDQITRAVGITAGPVDTWVKKLNSWAQKHPHEAVASLVDFLALLDQHLTKLRQLNSWSALAKASLALVEAVLGSSTIRSANKWPEAQQQAFELVTEALALLSTLDSIEPKPTLVTFLRALEAELDTEYGRLANFGNGLLVAPLQHGIGLDLDFVAVVGLAEGTVPTRSSPSVFLNDPSLDEMGLGLSSLSEDTAKQHFAFRGAIAGVPSVVLTTPRGDLRDKRTKLPSRWLLQLASERLGNRVTSETFLSVAPSSTTGLEIQSVASFSAGLTQSSHHVSALERDLAELTSWVDAHRPLLDLPNLVEDYSYLSKPLAARAARLDGFNEHTGLVSPTTTSLDGALSATSLEDWATCPRRYFFSQVLGLHREEAPEEIEAISSTDRGTLVHKVLEAFFSEVIAQGPKAPHDAWTSQDHTRLEEIFEARATEFEEIGLTGYPTLWRLSKTAILADLHHFLDWDSQQRAAMGSTPIAAELRFGFKGVPGLEITIANGHTVQFRGSADRVDRGSDGQLTVIDYKTGLADQFTKLSEDDPVLGGTKLQLPLYALAATERFSQPQAANQEAPAVHSAYWFISNRGGFRQVGYNVNVQVLNHFYNTVSSMVEGISHGVFPGVPDPIGSAEAKWGNCEYCDFKNLCRLDRTEEWERVQLNPALEPFTTLRESTPTPETEVGTGSSNEGGSA